MTFPTVEAFQSKKIDLSTRHIAAGYVERRFLNILFRWGLISVAVGIPLLFPFANPSLRAGLGATGSEMVIWGLIDAILAAAGLRAMRRRDAQPFTADNESARIAKAIRSLAWNRRLDYLWITIGVALLAGSLFVAPPGRWSLAGHGSSVILQGGFLLIFDRIFHRGLIRAL